MILAFRFISLLGFVFFLFSSPSFALDIKKKKAYLSILDKQIGRVETFTVPVDKSFEFGTLSILIKACYTRPEHETPENSAYFEISEVDLIAKSRRRSSEPLPLNDVFNGWMFSSSLSLSAMEHPVYDVWLIECKG